MVTKRIISTLLAVVMLLSALVITVGAEDTAADEAPVYTYNTSNAKPTMDYMKGTTLVEEDSEEEAIAIDSPEAKLSMMDLRFEKDGYRLYVDAYSGEVATYCIETGETLFTNPYNINSPTSVDGKAPTDSIKSQLMSQLVVKYTDLATGNENTYYSYEWAASRGQVDVKNIKNGIRVEYTIGREESRMLVPRQIEKSSFETKILNVIAEALKDEGGENHFDYKKLKAYFVLKDTSLQTTQEAIDDLHKNYPITKKMAVYVLDSTTVSTEVARLEQIIKKYAPSYSYEDLDEDHMLTEYESEDENPPLFKMALEYTLDEYGVSVRLPANGIRFNETLYQLYSIDILPYMGAGKNPNTGNIFFPDGSGALFDFEKIESLGTSLTQSGKVYGQDYAYHTISGTHQEIIRYPVFGVYETETFEKKVDNTTGGTDEAQPGDGTATADDTADDDTVEIIEKDRGYLAVVEEGDALMELAANCAVRTSPYNTVKMTVYPRPQDTYNIADAISVGSNDTWTVVSSRKYTGNYRVRYIMLTDDDVAAEKKIEDYYSCDYVGMAKAYRDYLVRNKVLTKLTDDDVKENIPLYLETFGAIETTKRILSVPVNTVVALTSFENIQTMYNELSAEGVDNINFILTGYTKGGMSSAKVPYHLKWDKAVGGNSGFEELLTFAKEKEIGIFPDFDFAFVSNNSMFDGLSLKSHAVKTIDNRYTSKRVYSATKQTYISYFELAISPAYFSRFYTKLTENYLDYEPIGIAVSTLGSYLNSDFDEDEPYNREDAKGFTVEAFEYLDDKYDSVMTSGGNAYTWKYVDHITDVALDSSRFSQAAASIPFLGIVLHGYVQFAGTPINMEGNIDYAMLKAIENGASLNFILSYQNTDILKESVTLSQYYSVRYDIWFDDVVSIYNELNSLMKGIQTSVIVDHQFIDGERVPDDDELLADARAEREAIIELEKSLAEAKTEEEREKLLEARKGIYTAINDESKGALAYVKSTLADGKDLLSKTVTAEIEAVNTAKKAYDEAADADKETAKAAYDEALGKLQLTIESIYKRANIVATSAKHSENAYAKAEAYLQYLKDNTDFPDELIEELQAVIDTEFTSTIEGLDAYIDVTASPKAQAAEIAAKAKEFAENIYNEVKDIEGLEVEPYEVILNIEEEKEENKPAADAPVSKYKSDEKMIVLVTYENGTSFILNFNNYDITTVVDGVKYTISAYGYIVLTK